MKKIAILTSGGDAPGMNAAIRATVRTGHYYGLEMFGCHLGFQGLLDEALSPMKPENVANCIQHGGTILQTGRCVAFFQQEARQQATAFLKKNQIDGIVIIGGNGSFIGASLLHSEGGIAVMGIPATIDNDIVGTSYTIGFDTARNTATNAIDKIRDTASSHNRNFLVEVMGRNSGFLAVDVGIAGGAEYILTPEFPLSIEELAKKITAPKRLKQSSIIVVAEADQPGRSVHIAEQLSQLTGLQYRVCMLGHTQRGGSPTTFDRKIGSEMGYLAIKGLLSGSSHQMVAMNQGQLALQAIPLPTANTRTLVKKDAIEMNDILCI